MNTDFFDAVLFDMDGLTINSEPQWLEAEREITAEYGYEWTIEDQAYCLGGPLSKVGRYISKLVNEAESGDFFHQRLIELMTAKVGEEAVFMPGAQELLSNLNTLKIPLALVSASPRSIVDAAMSHLNPIPFNFTLSCDDVLEPKPAPDGYLKAAELLRVNIKKTLILEDSLTGVTAARASGAKVIAVPHLVRIEADHQTRIVHSLEELNVDILREFYRSWF